MKRRSGYTLAEAVICVVFAAFTLFVLLLAGKIGWVVWTYPAGKPILEQPMAVEARMLSLEARVAALEARAR